MKNEFFNKLEEKKTKIKERLKLKLEYSEKIKNNENNKIFKKYSNIKNNELPKIKLLNYINNNNFEDLDSYYNNFNTNDNNYILYNKIKKGFNNHKKENETNKMNSTKISPKNMHNMNLISFNENINNIYKKVTINDFNKEINQKEFYNMVQNLDNILEVNSPDKNIEDISFKNSKKIASKNAKILKNSYSFKNDKLFLNILNQNKEDNSIEESIAHSNKHKNRFDFLRANTSYSINKNQNMVKNKYNTNKNSKINLYFSGDNEENSDILEAEQNNKNKFNKLRNKKILYEEDLNFNKKNKLKKSFDLEIKNKDFNNKTKKDITDNLNSEEESSDITIVSLCSEDIKDISSDFFDL